MASLAYYRLLILLVCAASLSLQPNKASAVTSIDLVLRWGRDLLAVKELKTKPSSVAASSVSFGPDQSEKRRVRKGSDPIHNKYADAYKPYH